jgi:hypothetical protein
MYFIPGTGNNVKDDKIGVRYAENKWKNDD